MSKLTYLQQQTLIHLSQGMRLKDIAVKLNRNPNTLHNYMYKYRDILNLPKFR